jgi:hypothetical protein
MPTKEEDVEEFVEDQGEVEGSELPIDSVITDSSTRFAWSE